MLINKKHIFIVIEIFLLVFNVLVVFSQDLIITKVLIFLGLILLPGVILSLCLRIRELSIWEYLLISIGLGLFFLIFMGLLINTLLPFIGDVHPLNLKSSLIFFNLLILFLSCLAYFVNNKVTLKINKIQMNKGQGLLILVPFLFPIMSLSGAFILNNNGSNIVALSTIGLIALFISTIFILKLKISSNMYSYFIYMIGIALLLQFSLRSWLISGHDIMIEYKVYLFTKEGLRWFPNHYMETYYAYNSSLSITILPTLFYSFLNISDQIIFKFIFPLITALIPVGVFLLIRKYTNDVFAFLSSIFFASQTGFLTELTMLAKQEIALLFFVLMIYCIFCNKLNIFQRNILFIIFGISMIVSHYTTTYVAVTLFSLAYITSLIYMKVNKYSKKINKPKLYFSWLPIILLIIFSYLWYFQITKISSDLTYALKDTFANMGNLFSDDLKSGSATLGEQFNIFFRSKDQSPLFLKYVRDITLQLRNDSNFDLYNYDKIKEYVPTLSMPELIKSEVNPNVQFFVLLIGRFMSIIMKLSVLIGVIILIKIEMKRNKIDTEFIMLSMYSACLIGALIILPVVSTVYGLDRLIQQTFVLLAFSGVYSYYSLFKTFHRPIKLYIIWLPFIIFFLFLSGFIYQFTGGGSARMQLNNYGEDYNRYYTHKSEIESIVWLSKTRNLNNYIYADWYNAKKISTFGEINNLVKNIGIFPSTIDKNSYVYFGYTNTQKKVGFVMANYVKNFEYNIPFDFLEKNKNLVYSNKECVIYE